MTLTLAFAHLLHELAATGPARASAMRLVVDGLAVAALGAQEEGPRLLARLERAPGMASVIGQGFATTAATAARVNGAAMHVLDFEPMWNPANHALSTTLPGLLALAETEGGTGAQLLDALAAGVEAQGRLRLASGQFEPKDLTLHPPGIVGPIGSSVACGIFLGLTPEQLAQAIGIAASRAGGILANVGSMTKALHCGQAATAGLDAALLARLGFTADADALAGPRGFGQAYFGAAFDAGALVCAAPPHAASPGPAFKLYPSQYGTHFVISAALQARENLTQGQIDAVTISCPPMPYVNRPAPVSGLAGKFSFQYVAAAALLDGHVGVASFSDQRRFAPDMQALLPRIAVVPDPAREGRFDRMRVDLTVDSADGTQARGSCDGPPGIWGRPVSDERLRQKASDCLETAFGAAPAARILDLAGHLEDATSQDLRALMALMCQNAIASETAA